eukprot:SAG31_NODE_9626_length_1249_cov_1.250435_2_plen_160_part_00
MQSIKGLSRLVGSPAGAWLSSLGTAPSQLSAAAAGLTAAMTTLVYMPETMKQKGPSTSKSPREGKSSAGSMNPLSFINLFNKSTELSALTVVSGKNLLLLPLRLLSSNSIQIFHVSHGCLYHNYAVLACACDLQLCKMWRSSRSMLTTICILVLVWTPG